jgi:hypothetical protein
MSESIIDRDLNLSNFRIKNLGSAVDPNDAVSKKDLELSKAHLFENIESFQENVPKQDFQLSRPTDIYSCFVYVNGLLKSPSAETPDGTFVVRDYQIITFSTFSTLEFQAYLQQDDYVLVLYNTIPNQ